MTLKSLGKKTQKTFGKLMQNKYVLYLLLFLSITNVIGYMTIGDYNSVLVFVGLALITSYFTKNLIVVFLVALAGCSVLVTGNMVQEGMKGKRKRKKKKMRESLRKQRESMREGNQSDSDSEPETMAPRVDYKSTVDSAYSNLEKILGKGGMKGLKNDTNDLMNQQKKMMENLESFGPILNKAEQMMSKFSDSTGSLGKIDGLLGKLAKGASDVKSA
tara:strand:- start:1414 stop:2064 length:651 start_codon:yes stop_codon:yes gene_type:complete